MPLFRPLRSSLLSRALAAGLLAAPGLSYGAVTAPWQTVTNPFAADAARAFASPPAEYSAQFTWGWRGHVDHDVIVRDLDAMKALGVSAAAIEPGTGMAHPYLSPEWFDLVRDAVAQAKQRGMRIWIMDDGDYPSGLAGGKFTLERPDLRMKALAPAEQLDVAAGTALRQRVDETFIAAVATDRRNGTTQLIPVHGQQLDWTAPVGGDGSVAILRWAYRTMPTRSANNPRNVKDTTHSLMDYLSPEAARQFRTWTFDAYAAALGDELGHTVLGFRGDEPAYGFNPWTPRLPEEFLRRKGYDLRPYLPAFAAGPASRLTGLTDEQRRVYADYCDVWSDLYRETYFDLEAAWAEAHGVEMQLHVEHEEILPQLAIADGDYFKVFRHIQVPGIDIIWHQLWMDNPADFPKLASSAAHLYGHPRSMCEAFAAYRPAPNLKEARWLLDFLMSRGITRIEYMFWPASVPRGGFAGGAAAPANAAPTPSTQGSLAATAAAAGAAPSATPRPPQGSPGAPAFPRYYRDPGFPAVAAYVNRLSYLLGEGRPAADIGLYLPSSSFWVADAEQGRAINASLLAIAHQLIEHQRDFDFVDEQALTSVLRPAGDTLVNLSGQPYRAIIIPPAAALSIAALERLHAFVRAGGRVLLLGDPPALAVGRTFRDATGPADLRWATFHQANPEITPAVLAALPPPDVVLTTAAPLVSYTHRRLRDADVYFLFNSGDAVLHSSVTLAGHGPVEVWHADTGGITPAPGGGTSADHATVPLALEPWSTTVLVVRQPAAAR